VARGGRMPVEPSPNETILAALSLPEDRRLLRDIFGDSRLRLTRTFPEFQNALRTSSCEVVIAESRLCDGSRWTEVLYQMQSTGCPAPLIVADPQADDFLWAEVLNLGGFDLLASPFDPGELLHSVNAACRRYRGAAGQGVR